MTVDHATRLASAEGAATRPSMHWRRVVGVIVWLVVAVGAVTLFSLFWNLFGLSLGQALHAEVTVDDVLPLFWGFAATTAVLALAAGAAIVARRWVALVLAVLLCGVGGLFTVGLFSSVRSVIAPIEQVDPGPMPCQCYSGSVCDCPGG